VNAVAAQVAAALEKAKGDGFFNAVDKIVKKRGQGDEKTPPRISAPSATASRPGPSASAASPSRPSKDQDEDQ
jgi:hypothetical protein